MSVASLAVPINPSRKYVPASVASIAGVVVLLLAGLPVAVWLDLRNLYEHEVSQRTQVISELGTGLDLFLDTAVIDDEGAMRARRALKEALAALDARTTELGDRVQRGSATRSGSS